MAIFPSKLIIQNTQVLPLNISITHPNHEYSLLILNKQPSDEVLGVFRDVHEGLLVELPIAGLNVLERVDIVVAGKR